MRARLSSSPSHPRALIALLESLSLCHGRPLHAFIDADAQDVRRDPQKWEILLGDAPELAVRLEWVSVPTTRRSRDRFLGMLGEHRSAESLVAFAATGGAPMTILPEVEAEIRRLVLRDGWKVETTARPFGVHHTVVRRVIRSTDASEPKPAAKSILDPFKPYLVERLTEYPELTATRLLIELTERGYAGGPAVLRRFVSKIRGARARKAYLRVETEPGEQAQLDWVSCGSAPRGASLCARRLPRSLRRVLRAAAHPRAAPHERGRHRGRAVPRDLAREA
jgi:hypothetical protein